MSPVRDESECESQVRNYVSSYSTHEGSFFRNQHYNSAFCTMKWFIQKKLFFHSFSSRTKKHIASVLRSCNICKSFYKTKPIIYCWQIWQYCMHDWKAMLDSKTEHCIHVLYTHCCTLPFVFTVEIMYFLRFLILLCFVLFFIFTFL